MPWAPESLPMDHSPSIADFPLSSPPATIYVRATVVSGLGDGDGFFPHLHPAGLTFSNLISALSGMICKGIIRSLPLPCLKGPQWHPLACG